MGSARGRALAGTRGAARTDAALGWGGAPRYEGTSAGAAGACPYFASRPAVVTGMRSRARSWRVSSSSTVLQIRPSSSRSCAASGAPPAPWMMASRRSPSSSATAARSVRTDFGVNSCRGALAMRCSLHRRTFSIWIAASSSSDGARPCSAVNSFLTSASISIPGKSNERSTPNSRHVSTHRALCASTSSGLSCAVSRFASNPSPSADSLRPA